jgi:ketosteroid isomerase-like protein
MQTRSPKDVVRALTDAYNAKSLERVLELYRPDARFWDPVHRDGVVGREAIGEVIGELYAVFPDERMTIQTLAGDETHAVAEFRSSGTTASGAPFELELTEVYEVIDGQIASCRVYLDPEQLPA